MPRHERLALGVRGRNRLQVLKYFSTVLSSYALFNLFNRNGLKISSLVEILDRDNVNSGT